MAFGSRFGSAVSFSNMTEFSDVLTAGNDLALSVPNAASKKVAVFFQEDPGENSTLYAVKSGSTITILASGNDLAGKAIAGFYW